MKRDVRELSARQRDQIHEIRIGMWKRADEISPDGECFRYRGRSYRVSRGVFAPHEDSRALLEALRIPQGASVLDLGCGSGILATEAVLAGAGTVVAVDIDPHAIANTLENAHRLVPTGRVSAFCSDLFTFIPPAQRFDVILANLPFSVTEHAAKHQKTMFCDNADVWMELFRGMAAHLAVGGRAWLAQANFGSVLEFLDAAAANGFEGRLAGRNAMRDDPRIFYAFEMWLKDSEAFSS